MTGPGAQSRRKGLLFVTGLGRSGTTALMTVLSAHPEIVLGVERYALLWLRRLDDLTADRFERDAFFDFDDELATVTPEAHPRWRPHYDAMAAKWDAARYVGDKMTQVKVLRMAENLPTARFVCIVRDPAEVAASWEARASTEGDPWRDTLGVRAAVEQWNRSNRRLRRGARLHPDRVLVVDHRSFFGDPDGKGLQRILDWLDVPASEATDDASAAAHARYARLLRDRPSRLSHADASYVAEHADDALWRDLQELASSSG